MNVTGMRDAASRSIEQELWESLIWTRHYHISWKKMAGGAVGGQEGLRRPGEPVDGRHPGHCVGALQGRLCGEAACCLLATCSLAV